ncbi:MAG: hypothetical protein UX38_C0004G0049 [Microgenomates group bacterium GW2011_GWC1_46_16]|nr:MAG: hypothetical protein UX38_C0004G0049 [Microgenomates group bacterium GW2011_GWC1_46_16]
MADNPGQEIIFRSSGCGPIRTSRVRWVYSLFVLASQIMAIPLSPIG